MQLTNAALQYVQQNEIKKTPIYSANRFAKYVGDVEVESINQFVIDKFESAARAAGLSAWTIKGTTKDVRTLAIAHGCEVKLKTHSKPQRPMPNPVSLSDLDAIYPHLKPCSKQWLVLSFWTAVRLADAINWQIEGLDVKAETLRRRASKTGHAQVWPFPAWLRPHLHPIPLYYGTSGDWSSAMLRADLETASLAGNVKRVTPKRVRQAALLSWSQSSAMAGSIVHGSGLSILDHYLDPLQILESAAPRVKLPTCFGAGEPSDDEAMTAAYRRLDPQARKMISDMALRLAGSN